MSAFHPKADIFFGSDLCPTLPLDFFAAFNFFLKKPILLVVSQWSRRWRWARHAPEVTFSKGPRSQDELEPRIIS